MTKPGKTRISRLAAVKSSPYYSLILMPILKELRRLSVVNSLRMGLLNIFLDFLIGSRAG